MGSLNKFHSDKKNTTPVQRPVNSILKFIKFTNEYNIVDDLYVVHKKSNDAFFWYKGQWYPCDKIV